VRRLQLTAILAGALASVSLSSTATFAGNLADDFTPTPSGDVVGDDLVALVSATYEIHDGSDSVVYSYNPGGPSTVVCYYYPAADVAGTAHGGPDMSEGPAWPPIEGNAYYLYCYSEGAIVGGDLLAYDPGNPLGPMAATERAVAEALDRVTLPEPILTLSPPAGTPHLVGLPSWYSVDPWTPVEASATIAGVTATVTATPVTTTWDPGDGTPAFDCDGPGKPWSPSLDGPPPCGHTYQRSGAFALTVTTTWEVDWAATTDPGGSLGTSTSTSTVDITARQVQATLG
jgi:hypothetical protein